MTSPLLAVAVALVWSAVLWIGTLGTASIARSRRLGHAYGRPEMRAPRHFWGGLAKRPAGDFGALRALARASRLARGRTEVEERSRRLARASRSLSLVSTLTALSLLPFAVIPQVGPDASSARAATAGEAIAVLDLDYGLGLLAVLMLISCVSSTAAGLAERGTWARLAALRVATESLIGVALFFLLLAPIVLESDSLRLSEIVASQQRTFSPFSWIAYSVSSVASLGLDALRLPGWFAFRQPLTAILMVPTLYTLTRRPLAYHEIGNTVSASGLGFDADSSEVYWTRLDARFNQVLAAALFVGLFLGAGDIPYLDLSHVVAWMEPRVGATIPLVLVFGIEVGVFLAKLLLVLWGAALIRQATGRSRPDQSLRLLTRRLVPLAWANFLLIAAIELLELSTTGGSAG